MLTADTITDDQLRALRAEGVDGSPENYHPWVNATLALSHYVPSVRKSARAICAEILNKRAAKEAA